MKKGLIDNIIRSYKEPIKSQSKVLGDYDKTNVWYINPITKSGHSAPYPKELSDRVIKYYSYVNDTVLDPFMGSGTTALSCIDFKRDYVGFEYQKEYFDLIHKNIEDFKSGKKFR